MGIRATARVFGVKPDTILLWLRRAGEHCEKVSAYLMSNLHVEQVQLDELWTFVFKKEKTLSAWEKLHTEYGDTWVWTALDPTHKLVLSLVVGEHEEEQAVNVLQKLKAVVVNGCLPLLVSDQLPHYVQAILKVFGRWVQPDRHGCRGRFPNPRLEPTEDLHYATVNKEYRNGTVSSVTTGVVFGSVKEVFNRLKSLGMKKINTSFVERMNLTLRHMVSRLRRKGLTFSKKRQYLKWHLNLAVAYYHFVRPHRGLRRRLPEPIPTKGNGSPRKWDKRTPGMSAELTDHIWSIQELLTFRVPEISPV
jgi:IS1 family transposase